GMFLFHFFFFQAEDGIRDFHVTGVQTCALPILMKMAWSGLVIGLGTMSAQAMPCSTPSVQGEQQGKFDASGEICFVLPALSENRSEERRVGKEGRTGRGT